MIKERRLLKTRRVQSRRVKQRREIPFPFNSDEWVNALESRKEYVLWPAFDRRKGEHRNGERRKGERRLLFKDN